MGELRRYFLPAWIALCALATVHLLSELLEPDWSVSAWFGAALSIGAALGHLAHTRFSERPRISVASRHLLLALAIAGAAIALRDASFAPLFYAFALGLGGTLVYLYLYLPLGERDAAALQAGELAPDFALREQRGWPLSAESLRGHPVALVFIQGNWSPLCRAQLAELADWCALQPPAKQSRVLVISAQPARKTEQLALELPSSFWCCVDEGAAAAAAFGIARPNGVPWGLLGYGADGIDPAVVVLDADGRLLYVDAATHGHHRASPRDYLALLGRDPLSLTHADAGAGADAGSGADATPVAEPTPAAGASDDAVQNERAAPPPDSAEADSAAASPPAFFAAPPGPRAPLDLSGGAKAPATLRPAATVLLIRDAASGIEALLLRRGADASFLANTWVFPGGRVDAADCGITESDTSEAPARRAGAREAMEEAGLRLAPDAMTAFSHWTAPLESPKRYATWFFLAACVEPDAPVVVDGGEIVEHRWLRPAEALAAQARGEMSMLPPTFITLRQLEPWTDVAAALAHFRSRDTEYFAPKIIAAGDSFCNLYRGDAGFASGDPHAHGPRHRFWMSPDGWRYERDFDAPGEPAREDSVSTQPS